MLLTRMIKKFQNIKYRNMNTFPKNVLKPVDINITNSDSKIMLSCSKRNRGDDEEMFDDENTQNNNTKCRKRWSLCVRKEETEQLAAELGIGMLETDEVMNTDSTVGSEDNPSTWDFGMELNLARNQEVDNITPSCSQHNIVLNKENIVTATVPTPKVPTETEQRRELMRDNKETDEFCLIRRRPIPVSDAPDLINMLSDEVLLQILKWLPKASLINCSMVSKRFCRLSRDESLWIRLDLSCRSLYHGALGQILDRGVQIFRVAQTEIDDPAILPNSKSFMEDFQCKLQYLDLSMAVVSLDTLTMLFKRCRHLKKLSLENVPVNTEVCKYLSQNDCLEVLNLTMVSGLNLNCMKYLLTSLVRLKELNIGWTQLNNQTLSYVCLNLPFSLTRLNISGCRKTLLDKNVLDLVNSCPNLRELDLSDCTSLTSSTIDILQDLEHLRFLAMSRCYAISPAAFKKLKHMPHLASFDIHGHMPEGILMHLKEYFGEQIVVNKFLFSSVARPTVGIKRTSIWNLRVKD